MIEYSEANEVIEGTVADLSEIIASLSFNVAISSIAILAVLFAVSLFLKHSKESTKFTLFGLIVAVVVFCTLFLAGSTIYLNMVSSSKGPVHWHADFEIYACGSKIELLDPKGLSNKIGTATLHEHNDKRIHLEGVVVESSDASVGKFFRVIGGSLTGSSISVPTNQGIAQFRNGALCPDGSVGVLSVFLYKTINDIYIQQRLTNPADYIIAPDGAVPPGDCIIFEFGEYKEQTDRLCRSYEVAEQIGKVRKDFR